MQGAIYTDTYTEPPRCRAPSTPTPKQTPRQGRMAFIIKSTRSNIQTNIIDIVHEPMRQSHTPPTCLLPMEYIVPHIYVGTCVIQWCILFYDAHVIHFYSYILYRVHLHTPMRAKVYPVHNLSSYPSTPPPPPQLSELYQASPHLADPYHSLAVRPWLPGSSTKVVHAQLEITHLSTTNSLFPISLQELGGWASNV
jgi:hypothetical protein